MEWHPIIPSLPNQLKSSQKDLSLLHNKQEIYIKLRYVKWKWTKALNSSIQGTVKEKESSEQRKFSYGFVLINSD